MKILSELLKPTEQILWDLHREAFAEMQANPTTENIRKAKLTAKLWKEEYRRWLRSSKSSR